MEEKLERGKDPNKVKREEESVGGEREEEEATPKEERPKEKKKAGKEWNVKKKRRSKSHSASNQTTNSLSPGVESQRAAFPPLVATLGGGVGGPAQQNKLQREDKRKKPAAHFADPFPSSPTVPHLFLLRSHRPTGKPHWKGPPLLAGGSGCWGGMLSPSSAPARILISLPSEGAAHCRDPLLV